MCNSLNKGLEAKGWEVRDTKELLGLSPEEEAHIEIKLKLAESFREHRLRRKMTQLDVAKAIKSSQSRAPKMEAGDRLASDNQNRSLISERVNPSGKGSTLCPTMVYSLSFLVNDFSRSIYPCGSKNGVALNPRTPVPGACVNV
jgi:hypothetical protein